MTEFDVIGAVIRFVIVNFILLILIFVWVMKLRDWSEGTRWEKPLRYTVGVAAFGFDWYVNTFAATIAFLDLPARRSREVVTGRMKRYKEEYGHQVYLNWIQRWRLGSAIYLCNLANKHDKGHC